MDVLFHAGKDPEWCHFGYKVKQKLNCKPLWLRQNVKMGCHVELKNFFL